MAGILYIVPTPIGNLDDMTFRAIQTLKEVDLILAEDTRTSAKLLRHFEIDTPMKANHMHNEHQKSAQYVEQILAGHNVALISDAGTPAVSDPGFLMVREALQAGIEVICLPGATALIPALVVSGLPAHNFCFEGFLPPKKGRQTRLKKLAEEERTLIFYESPHRIQRTLRDLIEHFGEDRPASLSREISKKFEETRRGTLAELRTSCETHPPKGELVLCIGAKA
ncbi:16S rRNA (cytidine(1402)-2'-O)-methyltransferase [Croceimicrobium hydrocarbonivorans]|uniref:Ribosomal RNA small subunit methyltransferase I n=1 Tax=Croceimicrobium hydrocarbonivorans TaxID=2761580 RepID=A0A7H0VAE7_9FLAO|nr:16S rRNA (cytidine(1402)-2'-O)-methyltransferase [Croceimicrobium hydrocarbonivorans]QNR22695.1 16S rRNA (cytidine(1402)-2'-O)-methyltransferase [Croceimicrobium hydrocarbonivorans]